MSPEFRVVRGAIAWAILIVLSGSPAWAESGIPAADLLLWPKNSVPIEAFTPVPMEPTAQPIPLEPVDPEQLQADLQAELWKEIPTITPELAAQGPAPVSPPVVPIEPTVSPREPRFFLGGGILVDQLGRFASQSSGATSFASSAYFSLLGSFVLELPPFWKVSLWLLNTPVRKATIDGGESSAVLIVGARAIRVLKLREGWTVEPLLGLGLMLYQISGSGGTVQLNNGNGVTTFGFPSDASTANLFFLEAGVGLTLWRFRFENSVIATGVATSRRSFSYLSTLQFGVF